MSEMSDTYRNLERMERMGKSPSDAEQLITAIGAIAEMSHAFYDAMIKCGASPREAIAGMQSFTAQFWHESMEDARRKRREEDAE